jgi:hypothetical protein
MYTKTLILLLMLLLLPNGYGVMIVVFEENFWTAIHTPFSFGTSVNWWWKPRYKKIAARDGEYQKRIDPNQNENHGTKGEEYQRNGMCAYSHTKRKHKTTVR